MHEVKPLWFNDPIPARALASYLGQKREPYNRWKFRSVRLLVPAVCGRRVALDFGCGGGEFSVWLAKAGWQVTAVDASPHSIAACRLHIEQAGVSRQAQSLHSPGPDHWAPLAGRKFDLILAKDVIEHLDDDMEFLKRLKEHLAPGGSAIVVTQNDTSWNYWAQAAESLATDPCWCGWDETHVRFYNPSSLKGKLLFAKLKPLKWSGAYLIPYRRWLVQGGLKGRLARALQRINALSLFHIPELMLGRLFPFNRLGWSIAVLCRHSNE